MSTLVLKILKKTKNTDLMETTDSSDVPSPAGWRIGQNGAIHRRRQIKYPNGDVYDGEVVNGKRDGHGELKTSNFTYTGSFQCGLIDGEGIMIWNTFKENGIEVIGKRYKGSFRKGKKEGYGTLTDGKGVKYEGLWEDDKYHGKGKLSTDDGKELQEGIFVNGKLHCDQGKIRFRNGDVYEGAVRFGSAHSTIAHISYGYGCNSSYSGQFHYNMKQGIGTRNYIDGSTYRGSFDGNKINGHGTMHFGDDHTSYIKYTGQWEDGFFHGEGELLYKYSSYIKNFKGEFFKGLYHGKGKLRYRDGGYYEGEFNALLMPLTSCRHGKGTRVWASGNKFEGTWKSNLMAEGRYSDLKHCSTYVGSFIDDKKSGKIGKEIWHSPNGKAYYDPCLQWKHKGVESCRYIGEYKFGHFHGRGKFSSQNGRSYDGEWKLGKQHGSGVAVLLRSCERGNPEKMFIGKYGSLYKPIKYEGEWSEGKWHGKGKLSFLDGTTREGHFVKGHLVSQDSQ